MISLVIQEFDKFKKIYVAEIQIVKDMAVDSKFSITPSLELCLTVWSGCPTKHKLSDNTETTKIVYAHLRLFSPVVEISHLILAPYFCTCCHDDEWHNQR